MKMKKHIIGFIIFALTVAVTTQIQAMEADAPATNAIGMYNEISNGWRHLDSVEKTDYPLKDHVVAGNFCKVIPLLPSNRNAKVFDNLTLELCLGIIANFESNAIGTSFKRYDSVNDIFKMKHGIKNISYKQFVDLYETFGITKTIPDHAKMNPILVSFRDEYSINDNEGEEKKLNALRLFLAIDFAALRYMCENPDKDTSDKQYLNILYKAIELHGSIK